MTGNNVAFLEPQSLQNTSDVNVCMWYNTSYNGVFPVMTSLLDSAILNTEIASKNVTLISNYKMLPSTSITANLISVIFVLVFCIYVSEGVNFMPIYAGVAVARERISQARLQQRVMGVWDVNYWLSNLIFDMFVAIPTVIVFFIAAFFFAEGLRDAALPMSVVLLLFALACLPFCYIFQFCFHSASGAEKGLSNIVMLLMLGSAMVSSLVGNWASIADYQDIINGILYCIPGYALFDTFRNVGTNYPLEVLTASYIGIEPTSPWDMKYCGKTIIYLACECIVFSIIVIFVERLYWVKNSKVNLEMGAVEPNDEDVKEEMSRVESHLESEAIAVSHVWKVYPGTKKAPPVEACRDVCFGVSPGDCFGLLGPNGAGKTSILSILMGTLGYNRGVCLVNGNIIPMDIMKAYKVLGYCPQFDVLFDFLTVYECLYFYGMIKGLPETQLPDIISQCLAALALTEHKDKLTKDLSGGNKRRLCVAIAFMGNPQVVIMDEPSTGLDPVSRRKLWNIIKTSAVTRSFLLTTHLMEEADALCNRIAIMVNGRIMCLGSSQHLKSKYGDGYTLDFKLEDDPELMQKMQEMLRQEVGEFEIREVHGCHAIVVLPKSRTLSELFRLMEKNRKEMKIIDYTLSQCTLDQVFLQFAKGQREETPGLTAEELLKSA